MENKLTFSQSETETMFLRMLDLAMQDREVDALDWCVIADGHIGELSTKTLQTVEYQLRRAKTKYEELEIRYESVLNAVRAELSNRNENPWQ